MFRYFKGPEETLFGVMETIRVWCPECGAPNSGSLDILNGRKGIMCTCGYTTAVNLFSHGTPSDATGRPFAAPAVQKAPEPKAAPPPAAPSPPIATVAVVEAKPLPAPAVAAPARVPDKPRSQTFPADKAK